MSRAHFSDVVTDKSGNVIPNPSITLVDPSTGSNISQTIYADGSSSTTLSNPFTGGSDGSVEFYLDSGALVKVVATSGGFSGSQVVNVFDPTIPGFSPPIPESDITNLATDLSGKAGLAHTHAETDVTNLTTDLSSKASSVHTHVEADVTNLSSDLAGKAAASHTHAESDVTSLTTDLAAKAASVHTHAESDVTSLTTDLAGKAPTVHTHAGTDIVSGTVAAARLGTGTAASNTLLAGDNTWHAKDVKVYAGSIVNPSGISAGNYILPRIPASHAGSVVKLQAYAVAASGSWTWNVGKNGTTTTLHSANITSGVNAWTTSIAIQNGTLAADDYLEIMIASIVSGTITQILIQVEIQN